MRKILFLYFVLASLGLHAQVGLGTALVSDIKQSNQMNPSIFTEGEFQLSLPSFYAGFTNQYFKLSEVLSHQDNVFTLNMRDLQVLAKENGLEMSTEIGMETFGLAYQRNQWRIALGHAFRMQNFFSTPKESASFLLDGNAGFIGENVNLNVQEDLLIYNELALGLAYQTEAKISFGARLKYLSGIATVQTAESDLNVLTDAQNYDLSLRGIHRINSSGLYAMDRDGESLIKAFEFGKSFFNDNNGLAFDFGTHIKINEQLALGLSALNLGKINWKSNNKNFESSGNRSFDGFSLSPLLEETAIDFDQIADSLVQEFSFRNDTRSFESSLATDYFLTANYQMANAVNLGFAFNLRNFEGRLDHGAAVMVNRSFGSRFNLGAQYTYAQQNIHGLGLNAVLNVPFGKKLKAQCYFVSDNVLPIFDVLNTRNYNLRIGANLIFNPSEIVEPLAVVTPSENDSTALAETKVEAKNKYDRKAERKKIRESKRLARVEAQATKKMEADKIAAAKKMEADKIAAAKHQAKQQKEAAKQDDMLAKQRELLNAGTDSSGGKSDDIAASPPQKTLEEKKKQADQMEAMRLAKELEQRKAAAEKSAQEEMMKRQRETEAKLLAAQNAKRQNNTQGQGTNSNTIPSTSSTYTYPSATTQNTGSTSLSIIGKKKLKDKTSLRSNAKSDSTVLLRFRPGDVVNVLEKTNNLWWRVEFRGQVGYVKAKLLE